MRESKHHPLYKNWGDQKTLVELCKGKLCAATINNVLHGKRGSMRTAEILDKITNGLINWEWIVKHKGAKPTREKQ